MVSFALMKIIFFFSIYEFNRETSWQIILNEIILNRFQIPDYQVIKKKNLRLVNYFEKINTNVIHAVK